MSRIHTRSEMAERRRQLRSDMTVAEKALWQLIRAEQLGVKFRRQHSVANYVLDFYCASLKLAIEVDGSTHLAEGAADHDAARQKELEEYGITFVRVTDPQVLSDATYDLHLIKEAIAKRSNRNK